MPLTMFLFINLISRNVAMETKVYETLAKLPVP